MGELIPLREAVLGLMTVLIIVGGVIAGVFTATESASIAVLWAFPVATLAYHELRWRQLPRRLAEVVKTVAMVMILTGTPILRPVIISIGVDPVHFGVIMLLNLAIGRVTPRLARRRSSAAPSARSRSSAPRALAVLAEHADRADAGHLHPGDQPDRAAPRPVLRGRCRGGLAWSGRAADDAVGTDGRECGAGWDWVDFSRDCSAAAAAGAPRGGTRR
jgi:hypothetical protein